MNNAGELKKLLESLPDNTPISWIDPRDGSETCGDIYVLRAEDLTEEELVDGYPDGLEPTLMICADF